MYDYKDNALHREENDNEATLYDSIIKDFIEREIKKSTPQHSSPQSSEIEEAFSRLSVAAIGMFNRNKVVLSVEELKMDLMCFWPYLFRDKEFSFEETHTVFGKFFFVNTSQSIQTIEGKPVEKYAYEFLHNTFGEFLAGDLLLKSFIKMINRNTNTASARENDVSIWHLITMFVTLSSRPEIINLIHKEIDANSDMIDFAAADSFLTEELKKVASGSKTVEILSALSDSRIPYDIHPAIHHTAVYALNLITLGTTLSDSPLQIHLDKNEWKSVVHFLKAGLSEKELYDFSVCFSITPTDNQYLLCSNYERLIPNEKSTSALDRLHMINYNLYDETEVALSVVLLGDVLSEEYVRNSSFQLQSDLYFRFFSELLRWNENTEKVLFQLLDVCLTEQNYVVLQLLFEQLETQMFSSISHQYRQTVTRFIERTVNRLPYDSLTFARRTSSFFFVPFLRLAVSCDISPETYTSICQCMVMYMKNNRAVRSASIDFFMSKASFLKAHYELIDQSMITECLKMMLKATRALSPELNAKHIDCLYTLLRVYPFIFEIRKGLLRYLIQENLILIFSDKRRNPFFNKEINQKLLFLMRHKSLQQSNDYHSFIILLSDKKRYQQFIRQLLSDLQTYTHDDITRLIDISIICFREAMEKLQEFEKYFSQYLEENNTGIPLPLLQRIEVLAELYNCTPVVESIQSIKTRIKALVST